MDFANMINKLDFVSKETKVKINLLKPTNFSANKELLQLLIFYEKNFTKKIKIHKYQKINSKNLKIIFNQFYLDVNKISESKFQNDLEKMNFAYIISIKINENIVTIYFLLEKYEDYPYISMIIHVINIFCHMFPSNYDGMNIYVCLDNNKRNIANVLEIDNLSRRYKFLNENSLAFTVSGMTNYTKKKIIVTKKEEIIKLLLHELIHYSKLDENLFQIQDNLNMQFSYKINSLIFSEAYTEFLAIILTSIHHSIFISAEINISKKIIFEKIISLEMENSYFLSSNVLKFFGYTKYTFIDFFKGSGNYVYSPISICEYVFIRSQLFVNINKFFSIIDKSKYKITMMNLNSVKKLFIISNELIKKINNYFNLEICNNFSYMIIDFYWIKL